MNTGIKTKAQNNNDSSLKIIKKMETKVFEKKIIPKRLIPG